VKTKAFAYTLSLWSLCFIEINDLPLLVLASVVTPDTDWCTFLIFATFHIKYLVALPIDELAVLVSEHLEPSRVGAPDLHVVGSTGALDVPRLIVVSCSNGE
jgi:hypothetical protein